MIKRLIWIIIFAGILIYTVPKLLYHLSLFADRFNSDNQTEEQEKNVLFPPILDTLPEATNSAELSIKGYAQNSDSVEIYINDILKDTVTIGTKDGSFVISDIRLYEGNNTIAAVAVDTKGEKSNLSDPMTVFFKKGEPKLVVESPDDGSTFTGNNKLEFRGITDPENSLTINGRWTRVSTDGTFKASLTLNPGENIIEIVAKDRAGNEAKVTRTVTYSQ